MCGLKEGSRRGLLCGDQTVLYLDCGDSGNKMS